MQRFIQLSGTLDFGGTGPRFTITLTGPSYTVERLFPMTEPSGREPLKAMIHFLELAITYWSRILPHKFGVMPLGGWGLTPWVGVKPLGSSLRKGA